MLLVTVSTAGPTAALILIALIVITNLFQGNILAPLVYGRTVEIHPALVLVALPAGAALFGIIGLFAALPIVAFILAITPAIVDALDREPSKRVAHGLVPTWLDRLGQWSWRGLVVIALLAGHHPGRRRAPPGHRAGRPGDGPGRDARAAGRIGSSDGGWAEAGPPWPRPRSPSWPSVGVVTLTVVSMLGSLTEVVDTSIAGLIKANVDTEHRRPGPRCRERPADQRGGDLREHRQPRGRSCSWPRCSRSTSCATVSAGGRRS